MEIEIVTNFDLKDEELNFIDMHSLLNVMNILIGEIYMIKVNSDITEGLDKSNELILSVAHNLSDREKTYNYAINIDSLIDSINKEIEEFVNLHNLQNHDETIESIKNISSIFEILKIRAKEIVERYEDSNKFVAHNLNELRNNFLNVFSAIEKNSKGRYRIIYNIAEHDIKDYLVSLTFDSIHGDIIYMPIVFQDVMRDLIANARKYTLPGGRITAGLSQSGEFLKFAVEDNGRGIPEGEIEKCVNYGYRASNSLNVQTKGGGFGLTKAYLVTKRLNGRMWIKSNLNEGTRIRIEIPLK